MSEIEIVVVDNGSTDGSLEFIKSSFPLVRTIALPKNYGFAKANNIGIRSTNGKTVALLNNDTVVDRHWLEELNRALDEHPEVGFCASKLLNYWKRDIIDTAGDVLGVANAYKRGKGDEDGPKYNEPKYIFGASAGAVIYRRRMLEDIGLFDETFVTNVEDVDLSFRAQIAGYKCMYVPTAVVYHMVGTTKHRTGWSTGWTGRLTRRNKKLMWLKNAPTKLQIKYLPQIVSEEGWCLIGSLGIRRWGLQRPNLQRFKMLLGVDAEVLLLLPEMMRKRREIQRRRVVSAEYIESLMCP